MMKKNLLLGSVVGLVFLASCGKDDDVRVPDPLEGTWILDSFQFTDVPVGFESWEGAVVDYRRLTSWDDYEITFAADNTFSRRIYVAGPDISDEGTWSKEGDELILVSDEDPTFDEEYSIESADDIELIWSRQLSIRLMSDAVFDTLTEEYANSLTNEEYNTLLLTEVSLRLNYVLNKAGE